MNARGRELKICDGGPYGHIAPPALFEPSRHQMTLSLCVSDFTLAIFEMLNDPISQSHALLNDPFHNALLGMLTV